MQARQPSQPFPQTPPPFAGMWSNFRHEGCCPICGHWTRPGKDGKTEKPVGRFRVHRVQCVHCGGGWFKAIEVDETVIS